MILTFAIEIVWCEHVAIADSVKVIVALKYIILMVAMGRYISELQIMNLNEQMVRKLNKVSYHLQNVCLSRIVVWIKMVVVSSSPELKITGHFPTQDKFTVCFQWGSQ